MANFIFLDTWRTAGLVAGFSGRDGGLSVEPFTSLNLGLNVGDEASRVLDNRRKVARILGQPANNLTYMEQVHGAKVAVVREADIGRGATDAMHTIHGVDGMTTRLHNVVLSVLAADCVPILFADAKAQIVGVAHAGWRGVAQGVAVSTARSMVQLGAKKERIQVAFGPAIRGCCYEVDEPVIRELELTSKKRLGTDPAWMRPSDKGEGHAFVDLPTLCREQLVTYGLDPRLMTDVSICTHCMPGHYSYRRDQGTTGRHGGFIFSSVGG